MQKYNNEEIGIAAEVAIAEIFNIQINEEYKKRAKVEVVEYIKPIVKTIFKEREIAFPSKHVAEDQNSIDFILNNGKTLSVKTNKSKLGKVAPQIIGQPTAETYFIAMRENLPNIKEFDIEFELQKRNLVDNYENRTRIFKEISFNYIDILIAEYWKHLVECDYLILIYNIVDKNENFTNNLSYIFLKKNSVLTTLDKEKISFANNKTIDTWKESCTVKYAGISIGEFQAHTNRNCFKFRFIMKGILKLLGE